jgi:hypothetical protein
MDNLSSEAENGGAVKMIKIPIKSKFVYLGTRIILAEREWSLLVVMGSW